MALQNLLGSDYFPQWTIGESVSFTTITLDAGDEMSALVCQAPKTGNIRKVAFRTGTVTTGATLDIRIETVDTATGNPTGTLFGTNTNVSHAIANGDDNVWLKTAALTADAAVTKGDLFAVVFVNPTVSPGTLVLARPEMNHGFSMLPYHAFRSSAGVWSSKSINTVALALEYDDGSYDFIPNVFPWVAITAQTFNSGTTPDARGLKFRVPFKCKVDGCWFYGGTGGENILIRLWDSDGATVLTSYTLGGGVRTAAALDEWTITFPTAVEITPNTYYRITLEPQTTTNATLYHATVTDSATMNALQGGTDFFLTTAKDPNEESDWTDATTTRPFMGIRFSALDDGANTGGGGTTVIGVIGE